ncbi:MAG TPA: ThuA domain-containing protein [Phycisphaerae bacterium]|nr:ThuA domain-containing protein [Phycisphaerae bacterium]
MKRLSRRMMLKTVGAGAALVAASPWTRLLKAEPASAAAGKRILFFTRSQDFPHAAVTPARGETLGFGEKLLKMWGEQAGYAVDISKDGTIFTPERIAATDVFVFYTTGDLTQPAGTRFKGSDTTPAMTPEAKAALLKAIADGKGFVGIHSATDTFHSKTHDRVVRSASGNEVDPYIAMLGGEFLGHGSQQMADIRVVDGGAPLASDLKNFQMNEEWYSLVNLAPDLHVILVQETGSMKKNAAGKREWQYQRAPYPETWARQHARGRVFYTSMGHRQDVWESDIFQKVLMGGIAWAAGNGPAVQGNLAEACPGLEQRSPTSAPSPR